MAQPLSPAEQLRETVATTEEIKAVIVLALRIDLMSWNAIVSAVHAGAAARGFGVLSNEFRGFTRRLQEQMVTLRGLTFASVDGVSSLLKQARLCATLDKTLAAMGTRPAPSLERARREARARMDELTRTLGRRRDELADVVADAAQLGLMGAALARTAKIEAAHGGSFSPSLRQVADDFDATVTQVTANLRSLRRRV